MTTRRRLLWVAGAVVLVLVVLRFVVRWADATGRLPPPDGIAVAAVTVLALVVVTALLVRRAQSRRKR